MARQEILSHDIDWKGLVRHVARDQITVELSEGSVTVEKLVPVKKPVSMAELDRKLRLLSPLGDDAVSFEKDIQDAIVTNSWSARQIIPIGHVAIL